MEACPFSLTQWSQESGVGGGGGEWDRGGAFPRIKALNCADY